MSCEPHVSFKCNGDVDVQKIPVWHWEGKLENILIVEACTLKYIYFNWCLSHESPYIQTLQAFDSDSEPLKSHSTFRKCLCFCLSVQEIYGQRSKNLGAGREEIYGLATSSPVEPVGEPNSLISLSTYLLYNQPDFVHLCPTGMWT